jgi:DNA-3-methyladenine glycosylase
MKLTSSFYQRKDVVLIARELIGKVLHVNTPEGYTSGRIVETEAYSFKERACHAYNNRRTSRTETLFADGGTAYVYLCYGIHKLFNVVTNREGVAEAVLIRAIEPLNNIDLMRQRRNKQTDIQLTSGPGKLSEALGIGMEHNANELTGEEIWITDDGCEYLPNDIVIASRIGVDYAAEDAGLPWRFFLSENKYVSVR